MYGQTGSGKTFTMMGLSPNEINDNNNNNNKRNNI